MAPLNPKSYTPPATTAEMKGYFLRFYKSDYTKLYDNPNMAHRSRVPFPFSDGEWANYTSYVVKAD